MVREASDSRPRTADVVKEGLILPEYYLKRLRKSKAIHSEGKQRKPAHVLIKQTIHKCKGSWSQLLRKGEQKFH